ncbi:MAG: hypothetical protein ACRD1V_07670 [Vicinamibacterales bacterium]
MPRNAMSKKAAQVFAECAFATAQGMDDVQRQDQGGRPYMLDPDARDFWLAGHSKSIPKAMAKPGRKWDVDRPVVLGMAILLGTKAAQYAYAGAGSSAPAPVHVRLVDVKRASDYVRKDPRCVAAAGRERGGGDYGTF